MLIRSGMDSKSDRCDWKTDLENNIRGWLLDLRTIGFSLGAYPGCADLRSACLQVSRRPPSCSSRPGADSSLCAPFYLKAAVAPGTCGHPGCADLRSACLYFSPWPISSNTRPGADSSLCAPFYFKAALRAGDMRTGGPRTQPLHQPLHQEA